MQHLYNCLAEEVYALLTNWGQDGWILAKLFCVFLWTMTKLQSIKTRKKKKRTRHLVQSSSHLNQTSLVNKGCIIERAVYVFSFMTIFCSFFILHCQQHQKIINIILSLLLAVFFLCRIEAGSPNLTRWAHLACLGSQLEHRMRFILPTGTVGNIITHTYVVSPEK